MEEIRDLTKQTDLNNLTHRYKGNNDPITFIGYKSLLGFSKKIKGGCKINTTKSRWRTKSI